MKSNPLCTSEDQSPLLVSSLKSSTEGEERDGRRLATSATSRVSKSPRRLEQTSSISMSILHSRMEQRPGQQRRRIGPEWPSRRKPSRERCWESTSAIKGPEDSVVANYELSQGSKMQPTSSIALSIDGPDTSAVRTTRGGPRSSPSGNRGDTSDRVGDLKPVSVTRLIKSSRLQ